MKTLKDFVKRGDDGIENSFRLDLAVELKREAIEWIKSDCPMCSGFKRFFNITEEELK